VVAGVISSATKHYNSALRLAEEGMVDHALIEAESAVELWDRNGHFHNLLGTLYARKGLLDKAVEEWKKTLSLEPTMKKASDNIEKARKLEIFQAERAEKRPYFIAIGVLALLALALLVWAGLTVRKVSGLSDRVTALQGEVQGLEDRYETAAGNLAAAREVINASAAVERSLRLEMENRGERVEELTRDLGERQDVVTRQASEIAALQKRVDELEKRPIPEQLITKEELEALRGTNQNLAERVRELGESVRGKEEDIKTLRSELTALTGRMAHQTKLLADTEENLTGTERVLNETRAEAAQQRERVAQLRERIGTLELRRDEMARAVQLAQEDRYEEALARLDDVLLRFGPGPLLATVRSGIEEEYEIEQDPFERELRRVFEEERRREEPRLRRRFAEEYYSRAEEAFRRGAYLGALEALDTVEKIQPDYRGVAELRERILGEREDSERRVAVLIEEAKEFAAVGNRENSIRLLEEALEIMPEHPAATKELARVRGEQVEVAKADLREELRRDLAEVQELVDEDRLEDAVDRLELLEEKYAGEESVVRRREEVQGMIDARVARIPVQIKRARELFGEGNYDEVTRLMDQVLRWEPENRDARLLRTLAGDRAKWIRNALATAEEWYEADLLDEAEDLVEDVLLADPANREARRLRSKIEEARKSQ
jgi:tetratricopeptide (TPR) repeat protein